LLSINSLRNFIFKIVKIRPRKHLGKKARSRLSERRAQAVFGGRIQPASGALPVAHLKGDILSDKFLVDDKTTGRDSFSMNVRLWRKLAKEAWIIQRRPAFRIEFDAGTVLYVMDELTLHNLLNGNL
jgi:hypothetical protein